MNQPSATEDRYPLSWPAGWPRRRNRERARFGSKAEAGSWGRAKLTVSAGRERLLAELDLLGARQIVISSNVPTRNDGLPRSGHAEPSDPAVAVYFQIKGERRVLASDKWDRAADNLAALAAHVGAMRGQLRWGIGSLEQAFRGYLALMEMGAVRPWREVLGVGEQATFAEIEARRLVLLQQHHPDRGGSSEMAADINRAFGEARKELCSQ